MLIVQIYPIYVNVFLVAVVRLAAAAATTGVLDISPPPPSRLQANHSFWRFGVFIERAFGGGTYWNVMQAVRQSLETSYPKTL